MKINFDNAVWIFIFVCGCVFFWLGTRAKKVEAKRQAGILSTFLAACFFVAFILGGLKFLKPNQWWLDAISKTQFIVDGMMLGIYMVMWIFGHWKLLITFRKIFDKDSKTIN